MRPSIKRSAMLVPRPTKASLARQSKIRDSIAGSTTTTTITLKSIHNEQNTKSENDLSKIGLAKRGCIVAKNHLFKRRKSLNKLVAIVSGASLDNSTSDGETLKQVIVASLTENVKKIELEPKTTTTTTNNKENCSSKRSIPISRKQPAAVAVAAKIPVDQFINEEIHVEQIEPVDSNSQFFPLDDQEDSLDEPIDPTYAMDYIAEIMNLLYTLEKKYPIQSTFLTSPSLSMTTIANGSAIRPWKLTGKHRTIVVGWLIQLFYTRFHLSQDALHICIGLLDRFLQKSMNEGPSGFVTQKNLQLIAVATFLVAAKVEETHHPPVDELVYVTDHAYTGDQVKRMEKKILHELHFELNRPTSLQFLRRYSFISSAGDEQHAIGKFLIDMALLDVGCINLVPSLIAASATYIARYLLNGNLSSTFDECWPIELQSRTPYKTQSTSLINAVRILAQCLDQYFSGTNTKEYEILVKRYEHEQLSKASLYCSQQRRLIHHLATESLH